MEWIVRLVKKQIKNKWKKNDGCKNEGMPIS